MPWVRIDEEFPRHPKVVKAGPLGMAMQVAALCYCNQYLTDGFIPRSVAASLLHLEGIGMHIRQGEMTGIGEDASWQLIVDDLVTAGLWITVPGGWEIHDYDEYQPSRQEVLRLRELRKAAGQKGGQAKAKQVASKPPSKGSSKTEAKSYPVPVPESPWGEGSGTGTRGGAGGDDSPSPQAAASPSLVASGASSAAESHNPPGQQQSGNGVRCRHGNDSTTCGVCSTAVGAPPSASARAELDAIHARTRRGDDTKSSRSVHEVNTKSSAK